MSEIIIRPEQRYNNTKESLGLGNVENYSLYQIFQESKSSYLKLISLGDTIYKFSRSNGRIRIKIRIEKLSEDNSSIVEDILVVDEIFGGDLSEVSNYFGNTNIGKLKIESDNNYYYVELSSSSSSSKASQSSSFNFTIDTADDEIATEESVESIEKEEEISTEEVETATEERVDTEEANEAAATETIKKSDTENNKYYKCSLEEYSIAPIE